MGANGSVLYGLTWSEVDMPAGPPISRLRASARRTSGKGCSSWPMPMTRDWKGPQGRSYKGEAMDLPGTAQRASWPTPATTDHKGGYANGRNRTDYPTAGLRLDVTAQMAGWPTPMTGTNRKSEKAMRAHAEGGQSSPPGLEQQAKLAGWPTPTRSEFEVADVEALQARRKAMADKHKNQNGFGLTLAQMVKSELPGPARVTASGQPAIGCFVATGNGGQLSPHMSRWLQGLPPEWCEAAIRAHEQIKSVKKRKVK